MTTNSDAGSPALESKGVGGDVSSIVKIGHRLVRLGRKPRAELIHSQGRGYRSLLSLGNNQSCSSVQRLTALSRRQPSLAFSCYSWSAVRPIPFWFTSTKTKAFQPHSAFFLLIVLTLLDVVGFLARILHTQHRRGDASTHLGPSQRLELELVESFDQAENRRRRRYPRGTEEAHIVYCSRSLHPSTRPRPASCLHQHRRRHHENISTIVAIADGSITTRRTPVLGGVRDGRSRIGRRLV